MPEPEPQPDEIDEALAFVQAYRDQNVERLAEIAERASTAGMKDGLHLVTELISARSEASDRLLPLFELAAPYLRAGDTTFEDAYASAIMKGDEDELRRWKAAFEGIQPGDFDLFKP